MASTVDEPFVASLYSVAKPFPRRVSNPFQNKLPFSQETAYKFDRKLVLWDHLYTRHSTAITNRNQIVNISIAIIKCVGLNVNTLYAKTLMSHL